MTRDDNQMYDTYFIGILGTPKRILNFFFQSRQGNIRKIGQLKLFVTRNKMLS